MTDTTVSEVREISSTRPLAAIEHRCTVCGLPIAIGTRYQKFALYNRNALRRKDRLVTVRWHLPYCPKGESNE